MPTTSWTDLKWPILAVAAATAATATVASYSLYPRRDKKAQTSDTALENIDTVLMRSKLPKDFPSWRHPPGHGLTSFEPGEAIWRTMSSFFESKGYTLWDYDFLSRLVAPKTGVIPTGFMYVMHYNGCPKTPENVARLLEYQYVNPLTRAARTADGRDVILRVLAIGDVGRDHIRILKFVSQGTFSFLHTCHTLPLLDLVHLEDITFGVFPKAAFSAIYAYHKDLVRGVSVHDVLNIIVQCLEALVFLHAHYCAHRDVARDNFLLQWYPQGLKAYRHIPATHPRVYINDLELAVSFPWGTPKEQQVCVGIPLGGSVDKNTRPMPPEVLSGKPYCPYKLDVWQLGTAFSDFRSGIPEIDAVLDSLTDPNPETRPAAYIAMAALLDAVAAIPPKSLMIQPTVLSDDEDIEISERPSDHAASVGRSPADGSLAGLTPGAALPDVEDAS